MPRSVLLTVMKNMPGRPALFEAACAATGFMRQMSIKPFTPVNRHREFMLKDSVASLHACRAQIFKERGSGPTPTIVLGGFISDATEQVEFQRALFRQFGSIYYLNYPRNDFSSDVFFAQLADLIEELNNRDQRPVLFGVSFGCGLITRFLQEYPDAPLLRVRGVVMASPVLCAEDLVRPNHERSGGVRMLESNLRRILSAGSGNGEVLRQIERVRRCFQAAFDTRSPNGEVSSRLVNVKNRIMEVVNKTPAIGGYQRVLALKQFARPDGTRPIFSGPALTLLAEDEEDVLVPSSPTLAMLRSHWKKKALFPRGLFWHVTSHVPDDSVAHASLISHHHCYNPVIRTWYQKLQVPRLIEAV